MGAAAHDAGADDGMGVFGNILVFATGVLAGGWTICTGSVSGLVWETGDGFRAAALPVFERGRAGFTLLAASETGIAFANMLPESRFVTNQVLPNGAGVAAGDVDGDGWCDLYFCGLSVGNRLYRNLGGWRFEDITGGAGVACANRDCTGAALADLDGDGDLDLAVNSIGGGTHLYFNNGRGGFAASPTPLNPGRGGTSLALADADGDGDLDLYVANYRTSTLMDAPGTRFTIKVVDGRPFVAAINGRPPTDPEWTNRFRFSFDLGSGGVGRFAREELGEPDVFLLNDGHGRFTPVPWTGGAFLDEDGQPLTQPLFDWGLSVLFRDFNGDGRPDLYVCNDFATPDRFWLNEGQGRFRLAPRLALRQTSLASMSGDVADLDRDGNADFMVTEMLSPDHGRRLTQRNVVQGETPAGTQIEGRPQSPRNTLFLSRGDGTYAEVAQYCGVEASEWSWGPLFLDVDLDGYEDLLVPNGFERDNMNADVQARIHAAKAGRKMLSVDELQLRRMFPRLNTANLAFRNTGALEFEECGATWGFDQRTISQGACLADLDNDGDLDVAVNNMNSPAGIYRNESPAPRLGVRLRGRPPNTSGAGARITVSGGPVEQSHEMVLGGRYCSGDQAQRTFAAGSGRSLDVRVRWRSGRETILTNIGPNRLVEIIEPDGTAPASSAGPIEMGQGTVGERGLRRDRGGGQAPESPAIRFVEVSSAIRHVHADAPYDDFGRQPLLPRKLSQLGPGAAWWDMDGDGRDDLVIGGGRGGEAALFLNLGDARFKRSTHEAWRRALEHDMAGLAGIGPGELLGAMANYEEGVTNGTGVAVWREEGPTGMLPLGPASFGPIAVADFDGDGDLDLFVGARAGSGRYPEAVASELWRREGGGFELDRDNAARLPRGLVSGAIWTELTGDGWPELVLACDWGPIRVFRNKRGRLSEWKVPVNVQRSTFNVQHSTPSRALAINAHPSTLNEMTGWWNGVGAGDFDNDGLLDLVVANWGSNTRYQRWRPHALRLTFGDFDEDGAVETIENHYAPALRAYAPDRMLDVVTRALPSLAGHFPSHQSWAAATIDAVLGEWGGSAHQVEAVWLESALLLNRADHFEVRVLSAEAQFAPAFAVCVGDADGDGNEDVFLSQNFFGVSADTSRSDAGRGLWLRGDGRGGLDPVRGEDCGVRVYGEQRGAALADFDADGRVDFAVTQSGAETKLYRNIGAKPGLRVRLEGSAHNPLGLGAVMRLHSGDKAGPAREVRGGSGYWSQDSPVGVLGAAWAPTALEVRWPGGRVTRTPVPPGVREIVVRAGAGTE